jgi:hypothetical protein
MRLRLEQAELMLAAPASCGHSLADTARIHLTNVSCCCCCTLHCMHAGGVYASLVARQLAGGASLDDSESLSAVKATEACAAAAAAATAADGEGLNGE